MTRARHFWDGRFFGQFQRIDGAHDIGQVLAGHMEIDRGRSHARVSHEPLDVIDVATAFQKVCGKAVAVMPSSA